MITWMQKHKKYLVITIWIATIAFIGAGFVGWGAYDFNTDRAAAVAKVGHRKITVQEFQLAYANNYNYYNNMLGGKLTKEEADKMGLEKIVLQSIINETLLLNLADDMGFVVLDEDIKNRLISDKNFQTNGVFDKNRYYSILKNMGISAKEYENSLKKELLLNKLQNVLKLPASKREQEVFTSAIFMQDRLSVGNITLNQDDIKIDQEALKKFWESRKENYKTRKSYTIEYIKLPLDNSWISDNELKKFWESKKYNYKDKDGKILSFDDAKAQVAIDYKLKKGKKKALQTYLKFKKGEVNPTGKSVVYDDDPNVPSNRLRAAKKGEVLKPIQQNDGYIIVKLIDISEPKAMSFDEAKESVLKEYKAKLFKEELEKRAKARLKLFKGKDIGFVSRDSVITIDGLTKAQSSEFLNYVFDQTTLDGYKIFGNTAILYRVLEQKLLNNKKFETYKTIITQSIDSNKQNELNQNLIAKLKKVYEIEQYYKGN